MKHPECLLPRSAGMDNGKLIENIYAAFNRGDHSFVVKNITDDVEWVEFGPSSIPYTGVHHGRGSVEHCLSIMRTTQSEQRIRITEIVSAGETVVATIRYSGLVNTTGRAFDTSAAQVFTIRNGKVASFRNYFDTAQLATAYTRMARTAAA